MACTGRRGWYPRGMGLGRFRFRLRWAVAALGMALCGRVVASEPGFQQAALPLLKQACFDCHSGATTEANLNLELLVSAPSFAASFKSWQKVAAAVEQGKMPPKDAEPFTATLRNQLTGLVRGELNRVIAAHASDPGEVVLRRLTSAEYAYTIQDLTGLDLTARAIFRAMASAARGSRMSELQFVEDSTLERYLHAAKQVAAMR